MDLNTTWFLLIGVLVAVYAILDGFDFGVGILYLFAKNRKERRKYIGAIGPFWDGNEVWLLTAGGAMFAAFPLLYATVFSGFYLAFVLLLLALIFRAVSLEFSYHSEDEGRMGFWDWGFGLGSLVPALLLGVAVGNVLNGLPIQADGSLNISLLAMLNPYSLIMGLFSVALFLMHGGLYLSLKTEGELRERLLGWINGSWIAVTLIWLAGTVTSFFAAPSLFDGILSSPFFWVLFLLLLVSLISIPVLVRAGRYGRAFLSSSLLMVAQVGLLGVSLFPRWVPTSIIGGKTLDIYNTASTPKTMTVMLVITLIALPFVLGYTIWMYKVFAPNRDK